MKTFCRTLLGTAVLLFTFQALSRADEAGRLQAARDLLAAEHMDQTYAKTIDQILDAQLRASPQLADMREPMKQFFTKYMGWDSMKEDMAKIYAQNFTEEELKQITAFYQSPTGQKVIQTMPSLMTQGMELGQSKVRDHLPELQDMITKAKAAPGPSAEAGPAAAPGAAPSPPPPPPAAH